MTKYAPCWNCSSEKVVFTGGHIRIALCGSCRVRLLTPNQAATLKEAQHPTVPEPEPDIDPEDTKPIASADTAPNDYRTCDNCLQQSDHLFYCFPFDFCPRCYELCCEQGLST
jgi:hypothetical protein